MKALKEECWTLKYVFLGKLYGLHLNIVNIAHLCHPYIETLPIFRCTEVVPIPSLQQILQISYSIKRHIVMVNYHINR